MSLQNRLNAQKPIEVVVKSSPTFTFLGIILVVLKLLGIPSLVNVSWWLILLPFYWGFALVVTVVAVMMAVVIVVYALAAIADFFIKRK